jgi:hypothetical protein
MRVALLAAVVFISACASDGLNLAPPPGVDFSGHWQLNVADSDDPMHLLQLANAQAASAADNASNSGRGGRGGRGGGPASGYPGLTPPATPSVSALADASRFPGKLLDIKQVGGVLTFASLGQTRVCQPSGAKNSHHHSNASDRDAPLPAARDAPPPKCGWLEKTLIVRSSEQDEDRPPFEEHYSISDDGRLVEEVIFRGGRSSGFTMSRVWDKSPQ